MTKKQNPRIDEDLDTLPPDAGAAPASEPRRRRMPLPDFEKTFLVSQDNTRTSRSSIYVSTHIKRMITEVVKKIGREHMTVTAYVDNILRHHLELYKDDINRIHKEQNSKNII